MNKKYALILGLIGVTVFIAAIFFITRGHTFAVLDPAGQIADKQRNLIYFALLLSLVVVIPVYVMLIGFAWKYRESNKSAKYTPDWDSNKVAETVWWIVPTILIVILSVVTWNSSHDLDPFKPLASDKKPITIQVVALQWKWLFIYPEQNIATVNMVKFPEKTPVKFEITADAPMNSFWIPQLGGQIYAMSGMSTHLNLEAAKIGTYRGSSANLSGRGFAGMNFTAQSTTETGFKDWVNGVKQSPNYLSPAMYDKIALPSENNSPSYYSGQSPRLYSEVIEKYMPAHDIATEYAQEKSL